MANEIKYRDTETGDTLYAVIRNAVNQYWDAANTTWETLVPASWGDYDITLTETPAGGYTYVGDIPGGVNTAGIYIVDIYSQVGGSPAITDDFLASGTIDWTGSAEVLPSDIAADTNELQTDWANGGRLDVILDGTATPAQVKTNVQSGMTDQGYTTTRAPYLDELAAANIPTDIDALLTRLTATRAGYLDNLTNLNATVGSRSVHTAAQAGTDAAGKILTTPANLLATDASGKVTVGQNDDKTGYELAADQEVDVTKVAGAAVSGVDDFKADVSALAIESNVEGHVTSGMTTQGYTSARGPYLDELAAANLPADIDSLLTRLTAIRAGYIDELGPTNVPADIDTLIGRLTAARATLMDNLSDLDVAVSTRNATAPDNTGITANGVAIAALNNLSQAQSQVAAAAALTAYDPPTKTEMDTATQAAKLASDGLDSISMTEPTGVASNFREVVIQLWRRFFGKTTLTKTAAGTGTLKTLKEDGTTTATTQAVADDGTTETQGEAS